MPNQLQLRTVILMGMTLVLMLIGTVWSWPPSQVQAQATLPPRNTPVPEADDDDDDDDTPIGAYIELQAGASRSGQWSQVAWQDSNGDWQPVTGWAGSLNSQGQRRWWVAAKDFGRGPFRWEVRSGSNGAILATSGPFTLPTGGNQTVLVLIQ